MAMKKIFGFIMTAFILTACSDAGDERPEDKIDAPHDAPTSNPNHNAGGPNDNSTQGVQDTSTVIDYDTAARKRQ